MIKLPPPTRQPDQFFFNQMWSNPSTAGCEFRPGGAKRYQTFHSSKLNRSVWNCAVWLAQSANRVHLFDLPVKCRSYWPGILAGCRLY
jgi:hypothetical protein